MNRIDPSPISSSPLTPGETQFELLVDAIRREDQRLLIELRQHWAPIEMYVRTCDPKTDLTKEQQAALILWLSTPPETVPRSWREVQSLHRVPSFVVEEREQQIAVVNQLWHSWSDSSWLIEEIERVLAAERFERLEGWAENLRRCFKHSWLKQTPTNVQARLDVVAGYAAYVDRLLLVQQGDLAQAWVSVIGHMDSVTLEMPDKTSISSEDLGNVIAFRSSVKPDLAHTLACAISLSLPVHCDVLPNLMAQIDHSGCRLVSTRDDPTSATEVPAETGSRRVAR